MKTKLKLLTGTAALMATLSSPAYAQIAPEDEVIVTGVRSSLKNAMDVKRDASGVVDAISAEDIGKFPDTNLAESLQRITGVSIDRENGEGAQVTVRGFGGQFNQVLLNGRQMPTANVGAVNGTDRAIGAEGNSRSFDFSNLASEGVSGIQVYKTGRGDIASGGIGATINIETIKPLSSPNRVVLGAKGVYENNGEGKISPELSGLASWTNDEGNFGVSGFASFQERNSTSRSAEIAGYSFFDYDPSLSFLENATVTNAPALGALMALPFNVTYNSAEIDRERFNGMATMQWAPSDRTTVTADALYTSNELSQRNLAPGIWYSRQFESVEFDGSTVVATPARLTELVTEDVEDGRGKDLFYASYQAAVKDETLAFGLNIDHEINDQWSFEADASIASSESGGVGPEGLSGVRFNVAAAGAGYQAVDYTGEVPRVSVGVIENSGAAGGNNNGQLDVGDIATQTFITTRSNQEHDLNQFRVGGSWNPADGIDVDFGVGYSASEMNQSNAGTLDFLGGWGVGLNDIPDTSFLETVDVASHFRDFDVSGVDGASGIVPPEYVLVSLGAPAFRNDPYEFPRSLSPYERADGTVFDFNNRTPNGSNDRTIKEDIKSLYVSANFDGEIAGFNTETVVGLRYEETDVVSSTLQAVPTGITWTSDNDFRVNFSDQPQELTEEFSYSNVLPSVDFAVDARDDLKLRFSVSQTIARPEYGDMFVNTSVSGPNTLTALGGISNASRGTARLEPLESTNFDVSAEWYYGDSSYISGGYFRKSVNNFVGTEVVSQPLFDLRDPTAGTDGTRSGQAIEELQVRGFTANEQNIYTMTAILDNPDDFPNGADDYIDPSQPGGADQALDIIGLFNVNANAADPLFIFDTSQPVNNETALIDGIELAWQHFFGESGFGFQANATLVSGDIAYDVAADPSVSQFALEGLSDSANLVGIYEKGPISARVAYNFRESFLTNTAYGGQGQPAFVDDYQQIDFNVTYNVNDQFSVSLDGINVTEENSRIFGRTENMLWLNTEGDARYVLSGRYTF
jgi:TonB-dependent receptor